MLTETILVVDDTDDLRTLTGEILRLAGFTVIEARNGAEALVRANERPDLIVLDVHMPDMDGFEVCRRLKERADTAAIPVLYLSAAYREERHRIRGLESGAAAYLTRPLEPADLVTTVRALMRLRHAEGEVATSAERFRHLFDRANDGVWTADASGAITYVNQRLAAMLGYDASEIIGRAFAEFVDPIDRPSAQQSFERQRRGITGLHELRCWRKDARDFWAIVSAIPLVDEHAETRGTIGVVIDITDRKRAEEALLRLASIVDSSDDGIIGKTLDGIILSWNAAAETMYGYSAAEAIGRSISITVPPDRHRELAEMLEALRRGERVSHRETIRRRKDGSTLVVSLSASPIQDGAGHIIGVSTITRDVTDRKRAESAEREAATLRSVASLATAAAHEINNPLTVIFGTIELLQRSAIDEPTRKRLERARTAAIDIQDIVKRMTRINRLRAIPQSPHLPTMLDLYASSAAPDVTPSDAR
jgi:PAS domain S-box-containing protein